MPGKAGETKKSRKYRKHREQERVKAVQELEKMEELIRFGKPAETKAGHLKSEFRPLFDEKAYCEKVEQVKHYIHLNCYLLLPCSKLEHHSYPHLVDQSIFQHIHSHLLM